jgi:transcriptional regulator with XRE-family HTH domain
MSPSDKPSNGDERFSKEELALLAQVGVAVRRARQAAGLTQQTVATGAHLQRSYVAGVEAGSRNVSVLNLARIAEALGLDLPRLLAGDQSGS